MDKKAINLDNLDLTEEKKEEDEKMARKTDMKILIYTVIGGIVAAAAYEFAVKPLINKVQSGSAS